jgi:hypothetical protein
MVQPINYQLNVQSPFEAALSGFKIGATIADVTAERQKQELERQKQELELTRSKELQTQIKALSQNQNPTVRDFTNIAMLLPKAEADSMRANWEALSKNQKENELRFSGQVISAFSSEQPQVGIDLLLNRAEAERNAGREDKAKSYETWANLAKISPQNAQKTIGIMLASVPDGDKVLTSSIQAQKAPSEISTAAATAAATPERLRLESQQTAAQIRNLDSQIADRANRIALDRDKLQSDVQLKLLELGEKAQKLDDSAIKIVNEATVSSVASEQSAARMLDLASRIEKEAPTSGLAAKGFEFYKKITGDQNAITNLRNEYTRIKTKGVLNNLPPGPASDKDIMFAAKGFPEETDSPESIASFLRGMAKIAQYDAVQESAKAEWANSVGSLGRAKRDIEIGGIQVPKGSTYVDFARQFMGKRAQELAAVQAGREVAARGYMRWANPQTGAVPGGVPAAPVTPAAPVGEVAAPSPFTGAP